MWDAIVIGAGVTGAATARELSRYEMSVLVLERGSDICAGTSKGNSAMVHAGFDPVPGQKKAVYNIRGQKMFDDLCAELDVPFERSGLLKIACSEEVMDKFMDLKARGDENGVFVEVCDRDRMFEIEPDLPEKVSGGLWIPESGVVCPYNLVFAMAENAAINGVEFRREQEVRRIEKIDGGYRLFTGDQEYETRLVFNCAGVYADDMNNMVSEEKIRIIPRQGEHLILDRKYGQYVHQTMGHAPIDLPGGGHTKGMGVIPSVDGTVILGCNAEEVEDKDDLRITAGGVKSIIDHFEFMWDQLPMSTFIPKFPRDGVIASFTGVRAHAESDDFIIGEAPDAPGFYNAAGIESPGLTAGPAIGLDLAEMGAKRLQAAKKENWIPGRKIKKPFREMTDEEKEAAIAADPDYAKVVCRCEQVTEAEIRDAIRRPVGARSVSGVKMRTRAGMGRCQGGFCSPRVVEILAEELGIDPLDVRLAGPGSEILKGYVCETGEEARA